MRSPDVPELRQVQGEHEGLKRELHARRAEAEEVAKAVHQQMHVANATLQAADLCGAQVTVARADA